MDFKIGQLVLPGDAIGRLTGMTGELKLGSGILQNKEELIAIKTGVLQHLPPNMYWIDSCQKRYVPAIDEMVIGIVVDRFGDSFSVDIGGIQNASLPQLSFEGATLKNRPDIHNGSVVYARILQANRDSEPLLDCTGPSGKSEGFGILLNGLLIRCNISLCKQLLDPKCLLLNLIGSRIPFEVAVGLNGRVWVRSVSDDTTVLIANTIEKSYGLTIEEIQSLATSVIQKAQKLRQQ